ncbi:MAG: putative toxin-antitoxin system toxin component, PIN family [Chloroflexota bacterium]|nr:putative toxin-antitoxin system toxin component, PIN family [Chloroflexota bacterium]
MFDASVWVSGLAYPVSVPGRSIELARELTVRSVVSQPLIDQTRRALLGPRFGWSLEEMNEAEARMCEVSLIVEPTFTLAVVTAKESDNRILECAVAGRADVIVTGDRKHLLPLGSYDGIPILSPADFLRSVGR